MKKIIAFIFIFLFTFSVFTYSEEGLQANKQKSIEITFVNATNIKEIPETCKNLCGDGICQEIVCMAIGCPCPETNENCPKDCLDSNKTKISTPIISIPIETKIIISPVDLISIDNKPVNFIGIKELPTISTKVLEINPNNKTEGKEIDVSIEINTTTKTISISVEDTIVNTKEIINVENKKMKMETPNANISINIMPSTAKQIVIAKENQEIKNMELVRIQTTAEYEIYGEKEVKILGIIPAKLEIKTRLNAENGKIEKIEKPWWSLLVI